LRRFLCHPLTPLLTFDVALTVCLWAYLLAGHSVSPIFSPLATFGWFLLLVLWTDADARYRRQVPCFDFGLLVWQFFPLSVAWYCLWSRGWRGLGMMTILFALWLAPYFAAQVFCMVLYGAV
jgi:hypothetical protein